MNIKYFAIRSIVLLQAFLLCQHCISQDNSQQLPNIGYDWDELYYSHPEAKAAAVAWVRHFDTITSEYTVKNIIEHCGIYFYKLEDNVIAEKLMKNVYMTMDEPNVQEFSKKMKSTVDSLKNSWSRYTYYQIWDFDYKFTISYPNGSNYGYVVPEYKKYSTLINDLHVDKSGREINLFDSVFNTIITINDTRAQLKLLFLLLNKVYILRESEFLLSAPSELNNYFNNRLTQITERIVNTASNSKALSRKEKAEWMLGCAKMLATIDAGYWGVYILPYIKRAEGELNLQKSDSTLLDFTTSIRALYWSSLSDVSAKEMAMRIMKQEFQLKKHRLSNFDCFRTFSFLAHIQLQKTVELKLELSPFLEREKLYAASYFITSSRFYNSSVNSNVEYKDCIIKLWVENYIGYHAMMENYSKTIPALYYLAVFQKESKRDDVKLDLPYKIYNLPLAYFNDGNRELANKWYQAWFADTTLVAFKENDLPEIIRLYNESQLEQLRVDVRNGYFPFRLDPLKERRYKAVHIAENSAKKGKWKDAYDFMAIADSMRPKAPTFDYMLMYALSVQGYYYPEQMQLNDSIGSLDNAIKNLKLLQQNLMVNIWKLDKRLSEMKHDSINMGDRMKTQNDSLSGLRVLITRTNDSLENTQNKLTYAEIILEKRKARLIIAYSIGGIILLLLVIAIYQWRRAKLTARFDRYRTNIWQELAHIPGSSIDDSRRKFEQFGLDEEKLSTLDELKSIIANLFTSIAKGETLKGNNIKEELLLAQLYIDYKNRIHDLNIELKKPDIVTFNVPPALLLSCVRNAIEHGKLLDQPDPIIEIRTERRKTHNIVSILNNGKPFDKTYLEPKNLSKNSTGFKNMKNVLNYFNKGKWIFKPVSWNNLTTDLYTVETKLKVKL